MSRREPWPAGFGRDYWYIRQMTEVLRSMISTVTGQGLNERNPRLVEKLIPVIRMAAESLAIHHLDLAGRRGGARWPYWANQVMKKQADFAPMVVEWVNEAEAFMREHKPELARQRMEACLSAVNDLLKAVLRGPRVYPESEIADPVLASARTILELPVGR